ncbi:MAG: glycosyltransferase family 2 protein [Acidobacteriota bacterium]
MSSSKAILEGTESHSARYSDVAVLIPCFNEEKTVGKVVKDFSGALTGARVIVFDNDSSDNTAIVAETNGATVVHAPRRGKGNVVKQMFDQVDAEVYLTVDGDDTYPASGAQELIAEFRKGGVAMVVGARVSAGDLSYRRFHRLGNRLVASLISRLFSIKVTDVMSGYRVLSREFVKSVPLKSGGFEVETEMTLQAATKDFVIREVPIRYGPRPEGSYSKLNTFSDGFLVLKAIFIIFKDYKPLVFFASMSGVLTVVSIIAGLRAITDYLETGQVYHLPSAVLATGTMILAAMSMSIGLILDTISKYHNENFQLLRRLVKKS